MIATVTLYKISKTFPILRRFYKSYELLLRPSRTARRKAKKPSKISGAMTMTPVDVLPESWVRALTRKVPTKDAPLPQMSSRP